MKRNITAGIILTTSLISGASGQISNAIQDWYHQREARFTGNQWRPQLFMHVRTDLEHITSARGASEKENNRLSGSMRHYEEFCKRILIPPSPGSNPGAPANDFKGLC